MQEHLHPGEQLIFAGSPHWLLVLQKAFFGVAWSLGLWFLGQYALEKLPGLVQADETAGLSAEDAALAGVWIRRAIWGVLGLLLFVTLWGATIGSIRLLLTRYTVTHLRVVVETGILSRNIEHTEVVRISDVHAAQPFLLRIFGMGNVHVISSDRTAPVMALRGIPDPKKLMMKILEVARPGQVFEVRT